MGENRKRTNAEIDTLNQFLEEGETPLPYEIETDTPEEKSLENNSDAPQSEEQKNTEAEKIKAESDAAKKILDDAEIEKNKNTGSENKEPAKQEGKDAESEISEDQILAYLKKTKGKEIASLDELLNPKKELTAEEKKIAEEKRNDDKIAYGLSNGLFNRNDLESFIIDTKDKAALVYSVYAAKQKEGSDELTDEEIKEEFDSKFGLNEDKTSRNYQAGQLLIDNIAESIIQKKHAKILKLDNEFDSFESKQLSEKEKEAKILSQAPVYKKDIEAIRNEIKKVPITISKDETFEHEVDENVVNEIMNQMLENNYVSNQIVSGYSKETLRQVAENYALIKDLPNLLVKFRDKALLEKQAGLKGVQPEGKQAGRNQVVELTENQKKALNFAFGEETMVAN